MNDTKVSNLTRTINATQHLNKADNGKTIFVILDTSIELDNVYRHMNEVTLLEPNGYIPNDFEYLKRNVSVYHRKRLSKFKKYMMKDLFVMCDTVSELAFILEAFSSLHKTVILIPVEDDYYSLHESFVYSVKDTMNNVERVILDFGLDRSGYDKYNKGSSVVSEYMKNEEEQLIPPLLADEKDIRNVECSKNRMRFNIEDKIDFKTVGVGLVSAVIVDGLIKNRKEIKSVSNDAITLLKDKSEKYMNGKSGLSNILMKGLKTVFRIFK